MNHNTFMYSVNQLYLFWIWILIKNMTVSLILIKTHNSGKWSCLKNISVFCFTNSSNEAVMWTVPCFSFALCICRDANLRKYVEKVHKKKIPVWAIAISTTSCLLTVLNQSWCPRGELQNSGMTLAEHNIAYFEYVIKGLEDFKTDVSFEIHLFTSPPFLPPNSIWEFPAGGEKTLVAISPSLLHFFSCGFPPARLY